MRLTCDICAGILIICGICWGVFAFTGFDLLYFLCFSQRVIYRCVLSQAFVAALFLIYALFTFKPFKGLK